MQGRKLVPKRRFKGFDGEWENIMLSTLMDFSNGINAPKENYGKGRKMISVMDILSSSPIVYDSIINSVQIDATSEEKNKVEYGDIIFVRSSETLKEVGISKAYLQEEYALYSGFSIRGKKKGVYDAYFVELLLNSSSRDQIERKSGGSTRYNISQSILNGITISTVPIKEQTKIGNFFKQLNDLIRLQQKKIDKLKALKQAYLFEMFPSDGEKVPKRRFKGFRGDWEVDTLETAVDIYDGTHQTPKYTTSGVMFLSVENIKTLNSDKFISEEDFNRDFKIYPEKLDVLMTRIGDIGTAKVIEYDTRIAYYVSLALIKTKSLNPYFLENNIHAPYMTAELWRRTLHIAFPKKINKNEIGKIKICYPSIEEQNEIGNFFKHLDDQINHQQRKLIKLQDLKKAYLNELFI